jgi:hypothetical protein
VELASQTRLLTLKRDDAAEAGVTAVLQDGTSLQSWANVPLGAVSSGPDTNGVNVQVQENGTLPDSVQINLPMTLASGKGLFVRLKLPRP